MASSLRNILVVHLSLEVHFLHNIISSIITIQEIINTINIYGKRIMVILPITTGNKHAIAIG